MSGTPYNGYSWKEREAILKAYHRGEAGPDFTFADQPCGLCGDPDRAPGEWHSEDYSPPFIFEPPATWPICKSCHGRLHKRFNRPAAEWELFCRHVEAGGYGREFTATYPPAFRARLCDAIDAGESVDIRHFRSPPLGVTWMRGLTLDKESLIAPWARPRPWRPRPHEDEYRRALGLAAPSAVEIRILRYHAQAARRTVSMREIAREVLASNHPQTANLAYGKLARRICEHLDWNPDQRDDGSPFWLSVVGEGWTPPSTATSPREFELVMVRQLAEMMGRAA